VFYIPLAETHYALKNNKMNQAPPLQKKEEDLFRKKEAASAATLQRTSA
jgi:hypothetical protein